MFRKIILGAAFAASLIGGASMAYADNPMVGGAPMYANKNIIQNAVNSKDHTTLVAAVKAAGLVKTLEGAGPFTVFAPTNEAFDALPKGTVQTLLKPENKAKLTKILTCHVVAADAMASTIKSMIKDDGGSHKIKTVGGCVFTAMMDNGKIAIKDGQGRIAHVTIPNVKQSNGVIHVVDSVLLPADDMKKDSMKSDSMGSDAMASDDSMKSGDSMKSDDSMSDNSMKSDSMSDDSMKSDSMMKDEKTVQVGGAAMYPSKNIIENAVNSKDHTTLVAAVKAAGLVKTLEGPGPFTVFAPTNEAFAKLPKGTVKTLLKPENKSKLVKILTAHVVAGKLSAEDLMRKARAHGGRYNMTAVSGDALTAMVKGHNLYIFDEHGNVAKVTIADVFQSNGVIQVVNAVLVPR